MSREGRFGTGCFDMCDNLLWCVYKANYNIKKYVV